MRAAAIVFGATLLAVGAQARGQDRPTVLRLPAGTRALGVGDAFVAGRGAEVIFYNPAMLYSQPGLAASVQRFASASTLGSLASTYAVAGGAVGVGVQMLDFGEGVLGVRSSASDLATRGSVSASSLAGVLTINGPPIKSIRAGVSAKYVEERLGSTRDGGVAFDVGAAKDFFGRTTLALAAQNLGSALHIEGVESPLPMKVSLGAAAFAPPIMTYWDLAATAAVSYLRGGDVVPAGGVELSYVPLDGWAFTGRIGARRVEDRSGAKPLTLGAGISLDRVGVDYAYNPLDGGGAAHRVGLRVR